MDRKQTKVASPTSSSASLSSKENFIEKYRPKLVCNTQDAGGDSMGSTSDGTPTFRSPLEAAMMQQHKNFKQGSEMPSLSKHSTPLAAALITSKVEPQPKQLYFEKLPSASGGGGFRVNTFEMVAEAAGCDSDRPFMISHIESDGGMSIAPRQ